MVVLRVALLSDQPVVQAGLKAILQTCVSVSFCGVFFTREDAKAHLQCVNPNILLVDWGPEWDPRLVPELSASAPGVKMVLLARRPAPELVMKAQETGAHGLLDTASSIEKAAAMLERIGRDGDGFEFAEEHAGIEARKVRLAPREGQLVSLLAQGLKNKEIAYYLGISEGTVKVYLSKLFRKVGAKDRFELALFGLKNLVSSEIQAVADRGFEPGRKVAGPRTLVLRRATLEALPPIGSVIPGIAAARSVESAVCGSYSE